VLALVLGFAVLFWAIRAIGSAGGEGFYAALSHGAMVAIFLPSFLLPIVSLGISLRRYWQAVGGKRIQLSDLLAASKKVASMKDLAAGHGDGCNFEDEDRFTHSRRHAHQMIMYGFLMCFAATSAGTLMHYFLEMPAPYAFWSLPKLLGVPGGVSLTVGCGWMAWLKMQSDRTLSDAAAWGGDFAFIGLLGFSALSGLALYVLGLSAVMPLVLALHLGAVLALFLLTPFTKMAHGFYRLAALVRDAQQNRDIS